MKAGLPVLRATFATGLMVAVLTATASAGPFEDGAAADRQGGQHFEAEGAVAAARRNVTR